LSAVFVLLLLICHPPAKAQTTDLAAATTDRAVPSSLNQARITQAIDEKNRVVLHGNIHPLARPEFDRGPAPLDLRLDRMLLVLKRSPEQETALQDFLMISKTNRLLATAAPDEKPSPSVRLSLSPHWLTHAGYRD